LARLARLAAAALLIPFGARAETISYGYDAGNRLETVQYEDGQSARYVYDNLGNQLIRLTLAAPQANSPPGTVTPGVADGAELNHHPTACRRGRNQRGVGRARGWSVAQPGAHRRRRRPELGPQQRGTTRGR